MFDLIARLFALTALCNEMGIELETINSEPYSKEKSDRWMSLYREWDKKLSEKEQVWSAYLKLISSRKAPYAKVWEEQKGIVPHYRRQITISVQ